VAQPHPSNLQWTKHSDDFFEMTCESPTWGFLSFRLDRIIFDPGLFFEQPLEQWQARVMWRDEASPLKDIWATYPRTFNFIASAFADCNRMAAILQAEPFHYPVATDFNEWFRGEWRDFHTSSFNGRRHSFFYPDHGILIDFEHPTPFTRQALSMLDRFNKDELVQALCSSHPDVDHSKCRIKIEATPLGCDIDVRLFNKKGDRLYREVINLEIARTHGTFFIHNLKLFSKYQGRGIARQLFEGWVRLAQTTNHNWIELTATGDGINFWPHLGFKNKRIQVGTDYISMVYEIGGKKK
jgi:GNAT superfamily N-acetyltransferase